MEVPFQENVVRVNIKTYSSSFSNVKHSHEKESLRTTVQCTDCSVVFFLVFLCQNAYNFLLVDEMITQLLYS